MHRNSELLHLAADSTSYVQLAGEDPGRETKLATGSGTLRYNDTQSGLLLQLGERQFQLSATETVSSFAELMLTKHNICVDSLVSLDNFRVPVASYPLIALVSGFRFDADLSTRWSVVTQAWSISAVFRATFATQPRRLQIAEVFSHHKAVFVVFSC